LRLQLPLLLPSSLLLLAFLLLCEVVADDAACRGADYRMMMRDVSRHGTHRGALDAPLCLRAIRRSDQEQRGQRRRKPMFRYRSDHLKGLVTWDANM
jgi:hypothetical protein